jgi:hypothetical protein
MNPSRLSDFIKKDFQASKKLELNFKEIEILDAVNIKLTNIIHLDLSFNKLETLDGIDQFPSLIYLNVSNNLLLSLSTFSKVLKKELISVLQIKGNPAARHPNLIPLMISYFPNLRELDGEVINYSTQKDIMQAMELSQSLIPYLYINEQFILKIHKEILFLQMKSELFLVTWNKLPSGIRPSYSEIKQNNLKLMGKYKDVYVTPPEGKIRPISVIEYIQKVQDHLQINSAHLEEEIVCKIYRWLYCEIILYLHTQGNVDLQCFLQSYEEIIDSTENSFRRLDGITSDLLKFSQLSHYPQSLLHFPVFGCNSEYIKALVYVLNKQVTLLQSLLNERKNILIEDFIDLCDEVQSPPNKTSYPALPTQEYCSPSVIKDFVSPSNRNCQAFFSTENNQFLSPEFRQDTEKIQKKFEIEFSKDEVVSRLDFEESEWDITNSFEELSQTIEELLGDEDKQEEKAKKFYFFKLTRMAFSYWKLEKTLAKHLRVKELKCLKKSWDFLRSFYRIKKFKFKAVQEAHIKRAKRLLHKLLNIWHKISYQESDRRLKIAAYFYEKFLKIKALRSLLANLSSSQYFATICISNDRKRLLSKAFKSFNYYISVTIHRAKKVRQHKIHSMKNTLKKILKSWLYIVRPSAKFIKTKTQESVTPVDRLLLKLKQKDKEIVSYFKKYKKKIKKV